VPGKSGDEKVFIDPFIKEVSSFEIFVEPMNSSNELWWRTQVSFQPMRTKCVVHSVKCLDTVYKNNVEIQLVVSPELQLDGFLPLSTIVPKCFSMLCSASIVFPRHSVPGIRRAIQAQLNT